MIAGVEKDRQDLDMMKDFLKVPGPIEVRERACG